MDAGALTAIATAFGLASSVLVYGIGHVSGGHINPAVTLGFMILRLQSIPAGLLYMLAQFSGAFFGALILWGCTLSLTDHCADERDADVRFWDDFNGVCSSSVKPDGSGYGPAFGLGVNIVNPRVSSGSAFLIELMGTFLLVFTVLQVAVHNKSSAGNVAPIAIGWAEFVAHLVLIPFTRCSINPARSFGPMIVDTIGGMASTVWQRGWWVFYTAPFVGSTLAALTYKFIFSEEKENDAADEEAAKKKNDDVIKDKMVDVEDLELQQNATGETAELQQNATGETEELQQSATGETDAVE